MFESCMEQTEAFFLSPQEFLFRIDVLWNDGGPTSWAMLCLSIGSFAGLLYLLVRVCRRTFPGLTSCGQCGYAVQGLTAMSCPECGSDFRQVGMVSPRQRRSVTLPMFLFLWTLCLPLPALALIRGLVLVGPENRTPYSNGMLAAVAPAGFNEFTFMMDAVGPLDSAQWPIYERMKMEFQDAKGNCIGAAEVNYQNRTVSRDSYYDVATSTWIEITGAATHPLSREGLLATFEELKFVDNKTILAEQADEMIRIIDLAPTTKLEEASLKQFTVTNHSLDAFTEPKAWFVVASFLTLPACWLAGIIGFALLTRARKRAACLRETSVKPNTECVVSVGRPM